MSPMLDGTHDGGGECGGGAPDPSRNPALRVLAPDRAEIVMPLTGKAFPLAGPDAVRIIWLHEHMRTEHGERGATDAALYLAGIVDALRYSAGERMREIVADARETIRRGEEVIREARARAASRARHREGETGEDG